MLIDISKIFAVAAILVRCEELLEESGSFENKKTSGTDGLDMELLKRALQKILIRLFGLTDVCWMF
jgi:hypothetical protein